MRVIFILFRILLPKMELKRVIAEISSKCLRLILLRCERTTIFAKNQNYCVIIGLLFYNAEQYYIARQAHTTQ